MSIEINITAFVSRAAARDYSASAAELGDDAGAITWNHAIEDCMEYAFLDTPEKLDEMRRFMESTGGWAEEEIAKLTNVELNALLIQFIAADMREGNIDDQADDATWAEYQCNAEGGRHNGNLFCDDDGRIYYTLSG